MAKKTIELQNVVWEEGKYFIAQCLNVDVSSFGKTQKDALANLNEALELYFEDCNLECEYDKVEKPVLVKQRLDYA